MVADSNMNEPRRRGRADFFDGRDLVLVAGLGLLTYGCFLVYVPAAFIVPGGILTYVAIFGTRN